ncbi:MAG TPA: hypothetical protein VI685_27245 [Candidatus Angelobacter sp.]
MKADGNVPPTRTISGQQTGLSNLSALALNAYGDLYAANGNSITVYPPHASGDVLYTQGIMAGINMPDAITVDDSGFLYVVNTVGAPGGVEGSNVTVYKQNAGGYALVTTVTGIAGDSDGIAVDHWGHIYLTQNQGKDSMITVVNSNADGSFEFPPSIKSDSLTNPGSAACDVYDQVYVANGDSVLVFASFSNGNQLLRKIQGPSTLLSGCRGVALDAYGNIYATNNGANGESWITVYGYSAKGDAAPLWMIRGDKTLLTSCSTIAVTKAPRLSITDRRPFITDQWTSLVFNLSTGEVVTVLHKGGKEYVLPTPAPPRPNPIEAPAILASVARGRSLIQSRQRSDLAVATISGGVGFLLGTVIGVPIGAIVGVLCALGGGLIGAGTGYLITNRLSSKRGT